MTLERTHEEQTITKTFLILNHFSGELTQQEFQQAMMQ